MSTLDSAPGQQEEQTLPPTAQTPHPTQGGEQRGERKTRTGVVVSDKMDKTVVVLVERRTKHPLYHKTVTRSEKYHAHDEANDAHVGDRVRIIETRPLSKTKRWRLDEVIERAK